MTKVKLCGLRRIEDIKMVNEAKPDFAGFILAKGFKRTISYEAARELKANLAQEIQAVGVFVNDDLEVVSKLLGEDVIDIAQLHGSEDEEYIRELRKCTSKPIIKVFKIETAADVEKAVASSADYILLDSGTGTGKRFDWSLLEKIERPFILAGGLSCDNIEEALENVKPYAVDVSSGTETDGIKDKAKIDKFVELVRQKTRM